MRLEIDVQPSGAAFAREVYGTLDEACADATMPVFRMDGGVEDGGMPAAIPGNVHETDKSRAVMGAEMAKAAREHRGEIRRPAIAPGGEPQLPAERRRRVADRPRSKSQVSQHIFGAGHGDLAARRLEGEILHHAVLNDHGEALAA